MTSKERLLITMRGGVADCVPVVPDMSSMIPCRLTGKPFWDIHLYQNPPFWKAHIDAMRYFGCDGFLEGCKIRFEDEPELPEQFIIQKANDSSAL